MGAQLTYGTAGATGGGWSHQPGSLQPAYEESRHEPRWSMQARSPTTWRDRNRWLSLWPSSRFAGGGTDAMVVGGQGLECSGRFAPFSCDGEGTQSTKFLKGTVVDASDVAVSGAIVTAHRTSDNAHGGYSVTSRDDGTFDCPTQFGAVNHYVNVYKAGSPDVGGTTVNTLVPANLDGS